MPLSGSFVGQGFVSLCLTAKIFRYASTHQVLRSGRSFAKQKAYVVGVKACFAKIVRGVDAAFGAEGASPIKGCANKVCASTKEQQAESVDEQTCCARPPRGAKSPRRPFGHRQVAVRPSSKPDAHAWSSHGLPFLRHGCANKVCASTKNMAHITHWT